MKPTKYYLYITTAHCQESHALNVCNSANLDTIKESIVNLIKSMNLDGNWWYNPTYAEDKAAEMVAPFANLLDKDAPITKKRYPFFSLGFILTNCPMWPDNKGGYEKDFYC